MELGELEGQRLVGRGEAWQEETHRGNSPATAKTSIWIIHPFLLLTPAAVALGGYTEMAKFCLFISAVHGVQLGTGGPQLVTVVANLDRKINFSYRRQIATLVSPGWTRNHRSHPVNHLQMKL